METNLQWRQFDLLNSYPNIVQGTFLRKGGVSTGPYATLNVGDKVGDNKEHVKTNREIIRSFLDVPKVVYANQVHGTEVVEVFEDTQALVCDAMITKDMNLALAITHADCQAALFYDPNNQAIGAAHCGWKGSVQNIYAKVIDKMVHAYGTEPKHLIVCISSSLGPCHAEFTPQELSQECLSFEEEKNHFNFWDISLKQLGDLGVKSIEIDRNCTFCDDVNFFSYRRDKDTGRHATAIALKS